MIEDELIAAAETVLQPYTTKGGRLFGDVGAAVLSSGGNVYVGVCVDTPGWGLCAERSAIAAMITAGEYKIQKVVAVWRDERTGKLYVLPPCGICRDFMRNVDEENLEAEVILGRRKTAKLKELIPFHEWPEPLDG
jgi:cytidine deaminase